MAIHVYTGDGKGKTTCAAGLAARCAGRGGTVFFYQFLKSEESGECIALKGKVHFKRASEPFGFIFQMTDEEKAHVGKLMYALWQEAKAQKCDMLVLDEIFSAMRYGFIPESEVLAFLKTASAEVVLTGRNAPESFIEAADYVTEMKAVKHIYEKGIPAREGIEY